MPVPLRLLLSLAHPVARDPIAWEIAAWQLPAAPTHFSPEHLLTYTCAHWAVLACQPTQPNLATLQSQQDLDELATNARRSLCWPDDGPLNRGLSIDPDQPHERNLALRAKTLATVFQLAAALSTRPPISFRISLPNPAADPTPITSTPSPTGFALTPWPFSPRRLEIQLPDASFLELRP